MLLIKYMAKRSIKQQLIYKRIFYLIPNISGKNRVCEIKGENT